MSYTNSIKEHYKRKMIIRRKLYDAASDVMKRYLPPTRKLLTKIPKRAIDEYNHLYDQCKNSEIAEKWISEMKDLNPPLNNLDLRECNTEYMALQAELLNVRLVMQNDVQSIIHIVADEKEPHDIEAQKTPHQKTHEPGN